MIPTNWWGPFARAALGAIAAVAFAGGVARATLPPPPLSSWSADEASGTSFEHWSPSRLASLVSGR